MRLVDPIANRNYSNQMPNLTEGAFNTQCATNPFGYTGSFSLDTYWLLIDTHFIFIGKCYARYFRKQLNIFVTCDDYFIYFFRIVVFEQRNTDKNAVHYFISLKYVAIQEFSNAF